MYWTTLRTYIFYIDAHLAKSKLESEGIDCVLIDENIVTLDPIQSFALGGIKLNVLNNQQELASNILACSEKEKLTNEKEERILCPKCQSSNIDSKYKSTKGIKGFFAILFAFLTLSHPIYYKIKYKCYSCDNIFSKNS